MRPFVNGDVIGAATGNQSGGPEADIANHAFNGGPYGAEVERNNCFFGYTFDANDVDALLHELARRAHAIERPRSARHSASGVAVDDADLRRQRVPAGERARKR